MAVPEFTFTGDLSAFTGVELASYGSVYIRGNPAHLPVPAELKVLVEPPPIPVDADGKFTTQLAAIEGLTYSVSVSPRRLFEKFTFAAAAPGETKDLSTVLPVPAPSPGAEYLKGDKGDPGPRGGIAPLGPRTVTLWGHSYFTGSWAGAGGAIARTISPTVASLLGMDLDNNGIGGSLLADSLNGWAPVLQDLSAANRCRFVPRAEAHVILHGLNDLGTASTHNLSAFTKALYAVVSRMRAGAIFEDSDASVSYGGTWGELAVTDRNSGAGFHYTPNNGATFTVTTPTDFPGGTLALGFTSWSDGGATITSSAINGQTYSINTAAYFQATTFSGAVLRIPNVPAGSAVYTFTVSGVVGGIGCIFDYWQWEQPVNEGVVVVLAEQPHLIDYSPYLPGQVVTDADVDALNAVLTQCAADFGGLRVVTADAAVDDDPTCFINGNVHPTMLGHRLIARAIANAMAAAL